MIRSLVGTNAHRASVSRPPRHQHVTASRTVDAANEMPESNSSSSNRNDTRATQEKSIVSSPPRAAVSEADIEVRGPPAAQTVDAPNCSRNNPIPSRSRHTSNGVTSHHHHYRSGRSLSHNLPATSVWEQAIRQVHSLPEGFEQRKTDQGQIHFYNSATKAITWYDPRLPREIIQLNLNLTELGIRLPRGWEERRTPSQHTGTKPYFVDHNKKTTQFTDPRLLNESVLIRLKTLFTRCQQQSDPNSGSRSCRSNSNSQPGVLVSSSANVPSGHRHHSHHSHNHHHHRHSTSKTSSDKHSTGISKRSLSHKLHAFRQELLALQPTSGHCRVHVSRDNLFEDSYRQIVKMKPKDLQKRLMVKFVGEEGLDYGGIAREWLHLLAYEMLNPIYGLFQYTREDIYTLQINPDSSVNPDHLSYFQFVGRIIGLSIFHGHYINAGFALPFYKMLLDKPVSLTDIKSVDQELYSSLQWILDNDITGVIENTFSVEHHAFGLVTIKDLKPAGRDIPVTEENKEDYVTLYVTYRFMRGIEQQFESLKKGISEVVPMSLLKQFDEAELELLIVGIDKIDVTDWKAHTRLKHCTVDSQVVKWFWQAVESMSADQRSRLLQFVTGTSRVPLAGFKALQGSTGSTGPRLFTLHLVSDLNTENLPKAHTCFNRIDLPNYDSYEKLREKLIQAIEETVGFNVE